MNIAVSCNQKCNECSVYGKCGFTCGGKCGFIRGNTIICDYTSKFHFWECRYCNTSNDIDNKECSNCKAPRILRGNEE